MLFLEIFIIFKVLILYLKTNYLFNNFFNFIDGKYSRIPIVSYMLIDIRETKKYNPIPNINKYTHTWFIVPNNEYSCFEVEESNRKLKIRVS